MPRMTGGQAVVETLMALGVDTVFGIPGVHTLAIYDALHDTNGIRHITTRHEQGAGYAADGYARVTGRPGVALVITGPGVTNLATPLGQAYSDSSPVLAISSTNDRSILGTDAGGLHQMKDQLAFTGAVCAWSRRVESVDAIPGALADAWEYLATSRPRPVHIEIPTDVLDGSGEVDIEAPAVPGRPGPDPELVRTAVSSLSAAKRPVIWVGGGAAEASGAAKALAERLGAALVSTVAGKGVIPDDHHLYLGSRFRSPEILDFLKECDVLLVLGSAMSEVDVRRVELQARLIHVDLDPDIPGTRFPVTTAFEADAALTAAAILQGLAPRPEPGDYVREIAGLKALLDGRKGHLWPLLEAVREAAGREGIVVNDMTIPCYQATADFPAYVPRTFLAPRGFGTLGFSLPAAIGAKVGLPDADIVALTGDGGFMFTMNDLATAVRYGLAIPLVLFNNDAYGIVRQIQESDHGGRVIGVDIANPDFMGLARAYRIPAVRCPDPGRLAGEISEALGRDVPTLIEVPIEDGKEGSR